MADDIFTPGIWVVLKPDRTPMESVCASSGYSARATALRQLNRPWSQMEAEGYLLVRCAPVRPELRKALHEIADQLALHPDAHMGNKLVHYAYQKALGALAEAGGD